MFIEAGLEGLGRLFGSILDPSMKFLYHFEPVSLQNLLLVC